MSKLGVIESEDAFYEILYDKWREYLHRIKKWSSFDTDDGT